MAGTEPCNTQGFGNAAFNGEIIAQFRCILQIQTPAPYKNGLMRMKFNQSAFPEILICGDSCLVIRKMVTYIPKKPFRVLIGNTDDGYSGLLDNKGGIYNIKPVSYTHLRAHETD